MFCQSGHHHCKWKVDFGPLWHALWVQHSSLNLVPVEVNSAPGVIIKGEPQVEVFLDGAQGRSDGRVFAKQLELQKCSAAHAWSPTSMNCKLAPQSTPD